MRNADLSTMPAPLVSVVLATYANDELGHLTEAVASVAAQTHRPVELVIVCDGPLTEEANSYLAEQVQEYPWIQVKRRHLAGGPGAARNTVLPRCRGDYIAILDADDIMAPARLSTQIEYLESENLDLVGSWLSVMDHDGQEIGVRRFPERWQSVQQLSAYYCTTANTSTMFRKSLLPHVRYPEHLVVGEDYRLWVYLMRRGHRIGNVPEPLTRYRTGSTYYQRRTGREYAVSDLRTKITAAELAPWWHRPMVYAGAIATVPVRLLPSQAFKAVYRVFDAVTGRGKE